MLGSGEFNSNPFLNHISDLGIQLQVSCPGTPEQNGFVERKYKHMVKTGLTILFDANLHLFLLD